MLVVSSCTLLQRGDRDRCINENDARFVLF